MGFLNPFTDAGARAGATSCREQHVPSLLATKTPHVRISSRHADTQVRPATDGLGRGERRRKAVLRTEEDKFGVITRRSAVTLQLGGGPRGSTSTPAAEIEEGGGVPRGRSHSAVDKVLSIMAESLCVWTCVTSVFCVCLFGSF